MNTSKWAKVFGIVFVLIGILGFVPGVTTDGMLLGIFEVDTLHNVIHLLTGIIALAMAKNSPQMFFKVFGVIYLIVTVVGYLQGDTVLGLIDVNGADNVLHLVTTLLALWLGFKKEPSMM